MQLLRLLPVLCASGIFAADVLVMEEIIAKVNGDIITRNELSKTRQAMENDLMSRPKANPAEVRKAVAEREKDFLRDKIDQLLLVQKGKELSINVDPQISKYIADLQRQFKVADQEELAKMVREQTGQSFEDWKNDIRSNMLTQRVVGQEVSSKISVPKADVAKYYEEHKGEFMRKEQIFLREIFLKTDGKNDAAVEKKAKDLIARAKKGERFGELARDNSDSDTATNFGELGGISRDTSDPALYDMLLKGGKGFVTEPLKRANGFVIFRVEEIHKEGQASLEEVEGQIMEALYMPKMQPAVREYLTKLRTEAFLEIRDGYLDSGAAPGKDTKWTDPAQLKPETISKEELANQKRRKRFLGVPVPFTSTSVAEEDAKGRSVSKAVKAK